MKLWKKFKDWEFSVDREIEFSIEHVIVAVILIILLLWTILK